MSSPRPINGAVLLVLAYAVARAQVGVAVRGSEAPEPKPAVRPEPRRSVSADPMTIARNLLSRSPQSRAEGFRQLADSPNDREPEIEDLRLLFLNLDSDSELESILMYTLETMREARVLVLDKSGNRWFCVGDFRNWHLLDSQEVERMLQLKDVVQSGANDVLIRLAPSGTDIAIWMELQIYRMRSGRLYRVFETTEEMEGRTAGPGKGGPWMNERRTVYFPEQSYNAARYIVVHHTKVILGDQELLTRANITMDSRSLGCVAYRWDAHTFRFVPDKAATPHCCDPITRRPRN